MSVCSREDSVSPWVLFHSHQISELSIRQKRDMNSSKTRFFCSVSLCDKKMEERGLPPSIPVFAEGPQPPPWANSEVTHWTTKDGTHSFHYLPGQEPSPAVGGRQLEDQSQLPSKNHAQYIAQDHMPCCGVLERARSPTYTGKQSAASWAGIPRNGSWLIDFPERKRHKLWSQGRWGR